MHLKQLHSPYTMMLFSLTELFVHISSGQLKMLDALKSEGKRMDMKVHENNNQQYNGDLFRLLEVLYSSIMCFFGWQIQTFDSPVRLSPSFPHSAS